MCQAIGRDCEQGYTTPAHAHAPAPLFALVLVPVFVLWCMQAGHVIDLCFFFLCLPPVLLRALFSSHTLCLDCDLRVAVLLLLVLVLVCVCVGVFCLLLFVEYTCIPHPSPLHWWSC